MKYEHPTDVESAQASLGSPGTAPLGGGTDLLVTMREGLTSLSTLVDLTAIPGGDTIEWLPDESLRLGAAVRIATIAEDARIRKRFPALAESCDAVGSPALRNMGTLGGNLCQRPRCWYFRSAIPCLKSGGSDCPAAAGENQHHAILGGGPCFAVHPSDPAVALTALEATIELRGPGGTRLVPIGKFFVLPSPDPQRENVLAAGEFVTAVIVPAHSSGGRQRYAKVLQRGAWDFALASIAAVRRVDGTVRMVLGGVAHIPWRVNSSVEEDVASAPLGAEDIDVLAERAMYDARPLAKNGYKVTLATNLIRESIAFLNA